MIFIVDLNRDLNRFNGKAPENFNVCQIIDGSKAFSTFIFSNGPFVLLFMPPDNILG